MAEVNKETNFNAQTASSYYDIYVMGQTGEGAITPAKLNIDHEQAAYFKSHAILSGNSLDPDKMGIEGLGSGATYFALPDFMEAVRFDYNIANQTAVNSYNELVEELGGEAIADHDSLGDLVEDHNEMQNWKFLDGQMGNIVHQANEMGASKHLIENALSAQKDLQNHGALAQETYDIYFDNFKPASPDANYDPINFDNLKCDISAPNICASIKL